MAGVGRLQAETEAFWRDSYRVSEQDLDLVTGVILDSGRLQLLSTLVSAVIAHRFRSEKDTIARQARRGQLYQPKGHYEPGQPLIFSTMEFGLGQVVYVREGRNPKFGSFSVIRVSFEDGSAEREFVADFAHPHPLNRPVEELALGDGPQMTEADVVRLFERHVAPKLELTLEANQDFLFFDGRWFLRELLPDWQLEFLLNLAEAMIDEGGKPLAALDILPRLEVDAAVPIDVQLFALNRALAEDERFDNVSMTEEPAWFLRGLEPEAVFRRPQVLRPAFRAVGGEHIGLTMLDLVEELGDELDDVKGSPLHDLESVRFEITFPHLYAGTMPATLQFLRMLPPVRNRHLPVTMVDTRRGERFDAWVVPDEQYVCGLGSWYETVGMRVGGQVSVTPMEDPLTFNISLDQMRVGRNEWVVTARSVDHSILLELDRLRSGEMVRCDRHMLVSVPDPEAILNLMRHAEEDKRPLRAIVRSVFEELSKLGRGQVHAKTVYSLANLVRRTGSVPVFAELTRRACYDPVGGGYWAYDPDRLGRVYHTPEEIRERPLSGRQDLVGDPVIQYQGR